MKLRPFSAAVSALVLAGTLSACGAGVAKGSGAGVAARVGDEVITVEELSDVVLRALEDRAIAAQAASDKAGFQRSVLTRMVLAEVYDEAARDLDIDVTDEDVTENIAQIEERLGGREQLLQAAAGMGLVEPDIAPFVRSGLLNDAVASKLVEQREVTEDQIRAAYEANREQFETADVAHILVPAEATARGIIARLRGGEDFAALARTFSTDEGSKAQGGSLGVRPRGSYVKPFEDAVFSARIGAPVGPVQTEFGYHVILVKARTTQTLEQARDELVAQIRGGGREQARAEYLGELSRKMRIRVNPRFGKWDADTASVIPADDELSSPEPQPGQVPPGGGLVPPADPGAPPGDPNQPPGQPQAPQQPQQPAPQQPQAPAPSAS